MQKLFDLWYAIPREREWWLDQFAKIMTGCFTSCFVVTVCYLLSVSACVVLCLIVAKNFTEAFTMGLAWGSTLGVLVTLVFGSAVLALIAWWRGV